MKKILIILSFLTLAITSVKAASLEFKTLDNTSIAVETEGLEFTNIPT